MNENDIFNVLRVLIGCEYISDISTPFYQKKAVEALKDLDLTRFDTKQIADVCRYLHIRIEDICDP